MKESKFVKTKIVAGYVILIAVCVLSVGYVYRAVVRFSTSDGSYSLLHTKRNVVGQTLYHLYQAESYGQLMIAGYKSYEARYKRELRTVRGYIDSLRDLTGEQDSLQTMRLDSIERLLGDQGAADDEPAADDPFGGYGQPAGQEYPRADRPGGQCGQRGGSARQRVGAYGGAGYAVRGGAAAQAQFLPPFRRPVQSSQRGFEHRDLSP